MISTYLKRAFVCAPKMSSLASIIIAVLPAFLTLHMEEIKVWWLVQLTGIEHLFPSTNLVSMDELNFMLDGGSFAVARRVTAWFKFSAALFCTMVLIVWITRFLYGYLRSRALEFDRLITLHVEGLHCVLDQASQLQKLHDNLEIRARNIGAEFRQLTDKINAVAASLPVVAPPALEARPQDPPIAETDELEHEPPERKREPERERDLSDDFELDLDF